MTLETKIKPGADLKALGFSKNADWTTLAVGHGFTEQPHVQAVDFNVDDDWSKGMRAAINDLGGMGLLKNKWVTEFGSGDARNIRVARPHGIAGFTAVEIDPERKKMAEANLGLDPELAALPHELVTADAVDFLDGLKPGQTIRGWVFMCLPQSPKGDNSADAYDPKSIKLAPYVDRSEKYGLTLNDAVLDKTNEHADPEEEPEVLIVNSHRVKDQIRKRVIAETGWRIKRELISEPIKQDIDTPVGWMDHPEIDDGERFLERTNSGLWLAISARMAEDRRAEARAIEDIYPGKGREILNVFHRLSFYHLIPARKFMVTGLGVNGKNAA